MATTMNCAVALAHAGWGDHMDWDGGWWVMMIGMLVLWALVVVGIVWLVRELSGNGGSGRRRTEQQPEALELLDRRLADGSISPDDYRERRAILTGAAPPGQPS